MCHYADLGSPSNWIKQIFNQSEPRLRSGSTVTWHQHKICALVLQTSFCRETSRDISRCQLFSQSKTNRISAANQIEKPISDFMVLFTNQYYSETSIKRTQTLKKYLKWSFLLFPTCIKQTLVIKFHHLTCQTPEMRKIDTHKCFNFYIKNLT